MTTAGSRDPYRTEPPPKDNMPRLIVLGVVGVLLLLAFWAWKSFGG